MRIAVPTNDGTSISEHFGRSAAFLVFDIDNGRIGNHAVRTNHARHSHEQGSCGPHSEGHEPHSHAGILESLAGCDVVICTGMGRRAAEALKSGGITPVLVAAPGTAEEAVIRYLNGELPPASADFCRCAH